jgi:N-terminal domain of anti-restriction factor ArdC
MPHPAPAHKSFADRNGLYQEITDRIIAELEQGRLPWVQPWSGVPAPLGLPKNAATRGPYSGINILILWSAVAERGFCSQNWLTFRQALRIGAHVKKSEKGTTVVYANRFVPYRERTRAARQATNPKGSRSSSASRCSTPTTARICPPTACRKPHSAASRSADPRDRRRYPDRRQPGLLCAARRLHPGAAAFGVLRAGELAPDRLS